ncbi:RidA family protein [Fodinicurvata sp. EGI_FJ10296]|uniref:RidA family protein n=1 Tax=Fodinicurvata sp. EGI_FJ10296 TaxID=3231908 RepID=UPI0034525D37
MSNSNDHTIVNPSSWPRPRGYSNAVMASGQVLYLGGQIGWTADQEFVARDFLGQTRQALENIVTILEEAGGGPEHIVRLTWYVTDVTEYRAGQKELGAVYRDVLGKHFPAMTLVQVSALAESLAKVEIEATAVLPAAG